MRPSAGGRIREPDLVYVTDEHARRITDRLLEGPADIVIEVVSRDSVARDRIAKLEEYKLARIPEYWIIDARPGIHRAEFLVLSTDPLTGAPEYESHSFDEFGVFRSVVAPALWVRRAWLFSDQPDLASALREVVGLTLSE